MIKTNLGRVFFITLFGMLLVLSIHNSTVNATERISGTDRYSTAVQVSQEGWKTANTVVLTTGLDYPDALAGGPLAYQENAPILLTRESTLPSATKEEIQRLKATEVIILGSSKAVSTKVENELKSMDLTITRIGGNDRYETAALIADKIISKKAIIASGENFPDALAIAPYAAKNGIPILLTRKAKLPRITELAIKGKEETIIVGGTEVISEAIANKVPLANRYAGSDRYTTAIEIISKLPLGGSAIYLTSGENFPDALAGSVLAAKNNASMALIRSSSIPKVINDVLKKYETIDIIGGISAVSRDTLFQSEVKETVNNIFEPGMTDLEKSYEIYLHMTENVVYDYTYTRYSAYDALVGGAAVCEGYALATDILMKEAGLETIYIVGSVDGVGHAWNLVKINNHYYHVDTTHHRFLQNDETIAGGGGRYWNRWMYPQSNGPQTTPGGWDFFVKGNDIYYNSAYKEDSFGGALTLFKRTSNGKEEVVTKLEPDGWILNHEDNWIYYSGRGSNGEIYRKNLSSLGLYETISFNDDGDSISIDNFNVKDGWIYIKGTNNTHELIIRINIETKVKEKLIELPYKFEVPVGHSYQSIGFMTAADDSIYYSIVTYKQSSNVSAQMVKEQHYKMKHDGSRKTYLRQFN